MIKKRNRISNRIMLGVVVIISVLILTSQLVNHTAMKNHYLSDIYGHNEELAEQFKEAIEHSLGDFQYLMKATLENEHLVDAITSPTISMDIKALEISTVKSTLKGLMASNSHIENAYLAREDGRIYIITKEFGDLRGEVSDPREKDWYKKAVASGKMEVSLPYVDELSGNILITVSQSLGNGEGILGIDWNLTDYMASYPNATFGKTGEMTLFDFNGMVIFTNLTGIKPEVIKSIIKDSPDRKYYEPNTLDKEYGYDVTKFKDLGVYLAVKSKPKVEFAEESARLAQRSIVSVTLGIIISLILSFFIGKYFNKVLNRITSTLTRLSTGDLTAMHLMNGIEKDSGDKTYTDIDYINDNYRNAVKQITGIVDEFKATVSSISQSSESTVQASSQIEQSMNDTVQTILEVTTLAQSQLQSTGEVEEALSRIKNYLTNLVEVLNNLGNEIAHNIEVSNTNEVSLNGLATSLGVSKENSNNMKSALTELNGSAKQIVNIVSVISDISSQTNLLALNASIEAARAGDAGRGFAVVAEEIRKLAEQTAGSTKNISKLISNIEEVTNTVSKAVETSIEDTEVLSVEVDNVIRTSKDTAESTAKMTRVITELIEGSGEIVEAGDDMVEKMERLKELSIEVTGHMEEMTANTEETLAMIEEVNASMNVLDDDIHKVSQSINKFKTS